MSSTTRKKYKAKFLEKWLSNNEYKALIRAEKYTSCASCYYCKRKCSEQVNGPKEDKKQRIITSSIFSENAIKAEMDIIMIYRF